MQLGCFGFSRQLSQIANAGFDDAELDICELAAMDAGQFAAFMREARAVGLPLAVFSGVIPLSVRFHSETFDEAYWLRHVRVAAERTAALGARKWTFGAGKCRSFPENCADPAAAAGRVRAFVSAICDVLLPFGVQLLIEPLGPANSNFLQTIPEAADFAASIGRENCAAMCDLRHMHKMGEDLADIAAYSGFVRHAHIDYPRGKERFFPKANDGYGRYGDYVGALLRAGYRGLLTAEATAYEDFLTEAKQSAAFLREILAAEGAKYGAGL